MDPCWDPRTNIDSPFTPSIPPEQAAAFRAGGGAIYRDE